MKIVVLDGYTLNPGDNPWDPLAALGDLTVYDRTNPEDVLERSRGAEILITNKTRLNEDTLAACRACAASGSSPRGTTWWTSRRRADGASR